MLYPLLCLVICHIPKKYVTVLGSHMFHWDISHFLFRIHFICIFKSRILLKKHEKERVCLWMRFPANLNRVALIKESAIFMKLDPAGWSTKMQLPFLNLSVSCVWIRYCHQYYPKIVQTSGICLTNTILHRPIGILNLQSCFNSHKK